MTISFNENIKIDNIKKWHDFRKGTLFRTCGTFGGETYLRVSCGAIGIADTTGKANPHPIAYSASEMEEEEMFDSCEAVHGKIAIHYEC